MANAFSSLIVRLALDATEFITGIEKSDREAKKFAASMERDAKKIGAALGIHISAGTTALYLMTKGAIDAADKLNDLSKSTGISVEVLGGLGFAAKQSGTDLEGVAASVGKLNIKIAAAISGNQEAVAAFEAVGISLKELRNSTPDQILGKLADEFATYDDHANTAALANAYFGKSYQSILPLLREGGDSLRKNLEYFDKYGGVNKEVVKQSDEFNDTLTKLNLLSGAFARNLAAALLPSLQGVANEFVKTKEKGDGFKSGAQDIAEVLKAMATAATYTATSFVSLGNVIGARLAQGAALLKLDFAAIRAISADVSRDEEDRAKRAEAIIKAINNPNATLSAASPPPGDKRRAPGLPDTGAASAANAAAKALLEAQLRNIDNAIKEERDLYRDREHFLQQYYQDDLIGIAQFYAQRQAFLDDAIRKEVAANDEKIALLQAAKPKDEADRIKNEREIADIIANTTKAQREYFNASIDGRIEEARAVKEFKKSVEEADAALMAMRGDTVGAAAKAFDIANEKLRKQLQNNGVSLAGNDELRRRTIEQAALTKATHDYSMVLEKLGIDQARIDLQSQTGMLSEIELLNKRADLARAYIPILTAQADAQEKIALAMEKGPARDQALLDVAKLRLGIDQLTASTDALKNKLDSTFTDGLTTLLDDLTGRTKNWKDAFLDAGRSIERTITHLINEDLAKRLYRSLFGDGGTGQTPGGWLSALLSLFGSGQSGGGNPFADYGLPIQSLFPAAANGTNYARGGWTLVGERGPELVNMPRGAQVIPNRELASTARAAQHTTINVNVPTEAARRTGMQFASAVTREQQRALRNA